MIILAGDHIYNMDLKCLPNMLIHNFSVACMTVEMPRLANQFGVLSVDDTGRITHFEEKPNVPTTVPGQKDMALVSMGVYLVSNEYLASRLREVCIIAVIDPRFW